MMTAMERAFVRAGGPTLADTQFRVALARYLNNGGTIRMALEIIRAHAADMDVASRRGDRMESAGQRLHANEAKHATPGALHTNDEGAGLNVTAGKAIEVVSAPSSPPSGREGHGFIADKATIEMPRPARR